jgi:hypothetical protein
MYKIRQREGGRERQGMEIVEREGNGSGERRKEERRRGR